MTFVTNEILKAPVSTKNMCRRSNIKISCGQRRLFLFWWRHKHKIFIHFLFLLFHFINICLNFGPHFYQIWLAFPKPFFKWQFFTLKTSCFYFVMWKVTWFRFYQCIKSASFNFCCECGFCSFGSSFSKLDSLQEMRWNFLRRKSLNFWWQIHRFI